MNTENHIQKVRDWLHQNVKSFDAPSTLVLTDFEINPQNYSGRFTVVLDNESVNERFSFGLGGNGKPEVYFPMFHSPLGAPASYSAVELTEETKSGICGLLEEVLPEMMPLGLNKKTGEWILNTTHRDMDRIVDKTTYHAKIETIRTPGYRATKKIKSA